MQVSLSNFDDVVRSLTRDSDLFFIEPSADGKELASPMAGQRECVRTREGGLAGGRLTHESPHCCETLVGLRSSLLPSQLSVSRHLTPDDGAHSSAVPWARTNSSELCSHWLGSSCMQSVD